MIRGRWFPQKSDISVPLALRRAVFFLERDALDEEAQQVVVYEGELPVGTARLWWAEGDFWVGSLGVLTEKRGKGYGDLLIRLVLYKALTHYAGRVQLACPPQTEAFFAKYGFTRQDEAENPDAQVHMSILGKDISLDGCRSCSASCGKDAQA